MSNVTMAAVALSLFLGVTTSGQQAETPLPDALDGVDVVVLVKQGKEVFGKSAFRSTHEGFAYLFASAGNKAEFDQATEKYAIQMGGVCARMGGTVRGNPSDYFVHEGRIYIFGSDECRKRFSATPSKYIPKAAAPMPTESNVVARGQALLDTAAVAHGGAKLDELTSYIETATAAQQRQMGPVSIVTKGMWLFPGAARSERTFPIPSGTMTVATVLTPAGAFGAGNGGRSMVPPPGAVPYVEATLWRSLIPVLRVRDEAEVRVAALGTASVGSTAVERVRVTRKGMDVTLNIDPVSGRVLSWSYDDRNPEGEVGEIVVRFDDLRPVDGVLVPFVEHATFNGAPSSTLSRRLDSATINVVLDRSLFIRPETAGAK